MYEYIVEQELVAALRRHRTYIHQVVALVREMTSCFIHAISCLWFACDMALYRSVWLIDWLKNYHAKFQLEIRNDGTLGFFEDGHPCKNNKMSSDRTSVPDLNPPPPIPPFLHGKDGHNFFICIEMWRKCQMKNLCKDVL